MFFLNYSNLIDPLLQGIRVYVPDFSGMKRNARVLDVCCGTGDQVFYYNRKGILAIGIDKNPNMIKIAKRKKRKLGLTNASFSVSNAEELPFKDDFLISFLFLFVYMRWKEI